MRSEESHESDERYQKIESASEPKRDAIPKVLKEIECGNHHARDRTEGVGSINERHLAATDVGFFFRHATGRGQSPAHQKSRHNENEK